MDLRCDNSVDRCQNTKFQCYVTLYATYIFSTSPDTRHRTTLLNTDVPKCHIRLEFSTLTQYLTTELSHSKLKYSFFNRAVSSTTYQPNINRIYTRNVTRMLWHTPVDDGATSRRWAAHLRRWAVGCPSTKMGSPSSTTWAGHLSRWAARVAEHG